jgi:hypothetical protein
VIRDWTGRKHKEYWQFIHGQRQTKVFLRRPFAERTGKLLDLSWNQLQILTGLLTVHCHSDRHLCKLRLVENPVHGRCKQEFETALHVVCDCEALAALRFRQLSQRFLKPCDLDDITVSRILQFVQRAGLHKRSYLSEVHGSLWWLLLCILFCSIPFTCYTPRKAQ